MSPNMPANTCCPAELLVTTLRGFNVSVGRHETRSHSRSIFVSQPSSDEWRRVISLGTAFQSATDGGGEPGGGITAGRPSLAIAPSAAGAGAGCAGSGCGGAACGGDVWAGAACVGVAGAGSVFAA